jgi:peptidyl-prolyl cis-trans isomerase C
VRPRRLPLRVGRSLAGAIAALVLLASMAVAQEATPAPLARVGTHEISSEDFRFLILALRQAGRTGTTLETLTPAGRERLLDALVEKDLYATAAREDGLDREPAVRFWVEQAVAEVLAKKYIERKAQQVVVTDDALREFYQRNQASFLTPQRVKVRHILVATRDEANAVLAEANAGTQTFAALAQARSGDAATREQGGDLGWVARGVMVKAFEDAVFALDKGGVAGPIETSFGFHVVKVEDVEAQALPAFEAIKDAVRVRKVATELEAVKAQLLTRYPVTIQRDELARFGRQQ